MLIDELDYYADVDKAVFEVEFDHWLPERIFDVHTHVWAPEHVLKPLSEERVGLVFEAESVTFSELEEAYPLLFPRRQVSYLAFGMPLTVVDRTANNRYVSAHLDNKQRFGLYVPSLKDDAETLVAAFKDGGFIGFKPYLAYVTWKDLADIRISDFVTEPMLEVADALALPIMLHVPRPGRLADPANLEDLARIAADYPGAVIVLAHGGRAYDKPLISNCIQEVAAWPNMMFDLSNVQAEEVTRIILERMGPTRVMYGSDLPVGTVRGKLLMVNGQRVCVTRKTFPWSISSREPGQLRCTFMGYEQLRATKGACESLGYTRKDLAALFHDTAHTLVTTTATRLYGKETNS